MTHAVPPDIVVTGMLHDVPDRGLLHYAAASPPDYRGSFPGSGLPFVSPQQAFHNTPNTGSLLLSLGGRFRIPLLYPNAYYDNLGTVFVPPTLYLMYSRNGQEVRKSVRVGDGMPYRDLNHPNTRDGPRFYEAGRAMEVRGQESVVRSSGYPATNHMQPDFWGQRPPL
jgi:hypothetical protein